MTNATATDDEPRTIDHLRVVVAEIKKFWLMGHRQISPEAERALWLVLRGSAKRLRN